MRIHNKPTNPLGGPRFCKRKVSRESGEKHRAEPLRPRCRCIRNYMQCNSSICFPASDFHRLSWHIVMNVLSDGLATYIELTKVMSTVRGLGRERRTLLPPANVAGPLDASLLRLWKGRGCSVVVVVLLLGRHGGMSEIGDVDKKRN